MEQTKETEPAAFYDGVTQIPVSRLRTAAYNPRQIAGTAESDVQMDLSVKEDGIIDPLIVRRLPDDDFEIVCGNRRFSAAINNNFTAVPCIIRDYSDERAREIGLIENLQRQTLHPMDEAAAFSKMADGSSIEDVAIKVAKTKQHVMRRLQLLNLDMRIRKDFLAGKFGIEIANQLARVSQPIQREVLKDASRYDGLTVKRVQMGILDSLRVLNKVPWDLYDGKLFPEAGTCVACPKRTGAMTELFPEVKKEDSCTDVTCFETKMKNHIRNAAESCKDPFVKVTNDYTDPSRTYLGKVLSRINYRDVEKEKCVKTYQGLIVFGEGRGTFKLVCVDPKCKIHWSRTQISDSERARRKKDRDTRRFESKLRDRITLGILGRSNQDQDLRVIGDGLLFRMGFDSEKALCKLYGVEPKKTEWGGKDYSAAIAALVRKQPNRVLNRKLLLAASLCVLPLNKFLNSPSLREVSRLYKINVDALSKEITKEAAKPKKVRTKK